ncbi:hypothetical protein I6F18_08035 [Bradyrhizobium sp. NBAIM32]|uniref:hypothetical protein n=1 Tax=Bradyrhizobium sp. NBAIM32 TaxID=2793809 RepID=UPI001CD207B4|nr:hypothetical protein [Bradyrhizobium sp. NBAIM32]MCA1539903.1 hypothetical protein [Bradyrhizobium sp. NBAIM32]
MLFLLLSLIAVLWSFAVGPSFRSMVPVSDIAVRIVAGDRFKAGVLKEFAAQLEGKLNVLVSPPAFARGEALIWLRVAEESMRGRISQLQDRQLEVVRRSVASALSVNPADAYIWMMLYSLETSSNGFDLRNIRFLYQSYAAGPREGWIALRRNRLALAVFPMLPDTMQKAVISEFAEMVDNNFIEDAAINLTSVGWMHRERLLNGLDGASIVSREALAKKLMHDGTKVSVPGVAVRDHFFR